MRQAEHLQPCCAALGAGRGGLPRELGRHWVAHRPAISGPGHLMIVKG